MSRKNLLHSVVQTLGIIMNADATGRLLKYDTHMKLVTVLKTDLTYPNGVAVPRQDTPGGGAHGAVPGVQVLAEGS